MKCLRSQFCRELRAHPAHMEWNRLLGQRPLPEEAGFSSVWLLWAARTPTATSCCTKTTGGTAQGSTACPRTLLSSSAWLRSGCSCRWPALQHSGRDDALVGASVTWLSYHSRMRSLARVISVASGDSLPVLHFIQAQCGSWSCSHGSHREWNAAAIFLARQRHILSRRYSFRWPSKGKQD